MLDGLKLYPQGRAQERLRNHPLLSFERQGLNLYQAEHGALIFTGDANRCMEMRGSFHRHYHGVNHGDFTFDQFRQVSDNVCLDFGLHPANLVLANVETGVNVTPSVPANEVMHAMQLHRAVRATSLGRGTSGIVFEHDAYHIKAYDKAFQFDLPMRLLRVEVLWRKMGALNRLGIRTLQDLLEPSAWLSLQQLFFRRIGEVFILEPYVSTQGLHHSQKKLLSLVKEPSYLEQLSHKQRGAKINALRGIFHEHASPEVGPELIRLVMEKAKFLGPPPIIGPSHAPDVCTASTSLITGTFTPGMLTPLEGTIAPLMVNDENVQGSAVRLESPSGNRQCAVCGKDIGHQDPGSKWCSERRNGRDGKSCRNASSNRTRTRKRLEARGPMLFDHKPFLAPLTPPKRRK